VLAADTSGLLIKRMSEAVDGDFQESPSNRQLYSQPFFGKYPELRRLGRSLVGRSIDAFGAGRPYPLKVYAAYKAAADHKGGPTVILAKTVKGYGLGEAGEGRNISHQQKR